MGLNQVGKLGIMQGRICPCRLDKLQVFPGKRWRNEFKQAKRIGFDYIELLYDCDESILNPLSDFKRCDEILSVKQNTRMETLSICADYFTKINLLSDFNDRIWGKISHLIHYAEKLRAKKIVIPFFNQNHLENQDDLISFLQKAEGEIKKANDVNVSICLETDLQAKNVAYAIKETASLAEVCYDMGNATAMNYIIEDDIELLGEYIGLIHIKDRIRPKGPNVFLGKGDVNFKAGFQALKRINYLGDFTLETAIGKQPHKIAERNFFEINELLNI